jgi:ribosome-associated translation inhibitor RaiA
MTTLLKLGFGQNTRRCDAKCYNATGAECECICGGLNHGEGLRKAKDISEFGDWPPEVQVWKDIVFQEELEELVIPELEEALKKLQRSLRKAERGFRDLAEVSTAVVAAFKELDWDDGSHDSDMKMALDELEKQLKKDRESLRRNGAGK